MLSIDMLLLSQLNLLMQSTILPSDLSQGTAMILTIVYCVKRFGGPLLKRQNKHCFLFIFKAFIAKQPSYISGMLEWNFGAYQIRSNIPFMCKVPQACSNLGKTASSVSAPKSWNTLLSTLKFYHPYLPFLTVFIFGILLYAVINFFKILFLMRCSTCK